MVDRGERNTAKCENAKCGVIYTHELINLHISAMAYYINTLDGERSVHGRCEPKCFKDGDLF